MKLPFTIINNQLRSMFFPRCTFHVSMFSCKPEKPKENIIYERFTNKQHKKSLRIFNLNFLVNFYT